TPGYWKNWNQCSKGNQAAVAERNGGAEEGFYLVEDLLPILVGGFAVNDCEDAVMILDRRNAVGKKMANDPAYGLASHLLAAKLNIAADAGACGAVTDAVAEADALLARIGFDATRRFLTSLTADGKRALELMALLDDYNNNQLCPGQTFYDPASSQQQTLAPTAPTKTLTTFRTLLGR
ncbi:MAG TPA: hypothetical protein VIU40_00830, partial [Geobacteraceae bacterium]